MVSAKDEDALHKTGLHDELTTTALCRKIMRDLPESSWLIPADKLEISTRKDGRPWHLGSGRVCGLLYIVAAWCCPNLHGRCVSPRLSI